MIRQLRTILENAISKEALVKGQSMGEVAGIRAEVILEEIERWRRRSLASRFAEETSGDVAPRTPGEPARWITWRCVEPDPGYCGRSS